MLQGHLDTMLLAVLAAGPAHGYALIDTLRERSEGAFDLPEGTVYPALHRLEHAGLVRSRWSDAGGRRRRIYELTPTGRPALAARAEGWRVFAAGVDAVLGGLRCATTW